MRVSAIQIRHMIWCVGVFCILEGPGEGHGVGTGKDTPFTGADVEYCCEVAFWCSRTSGCTAIDGKFEHEGTAVAGAKVALGLEAEFGNFGAMVVVREPGDGVFRLKDG